MEKLQAGSTFLSDSGDNDQIEKITMDYHRVTKIEPDAKLKGMVGEYLTWDYCEHLEIDRENHLLKHIRKIGGGCHLLLEYHMQQGIESLLDNIYTNASFEAIRGNPEDVCIDPLETKDYILTIDYLSGEQRVLTGTFDKHGLPDDFPDFMETVFSFIRFYGTGEMFDPLEYNRTLPRQSDYIFCNVQFDCNGKVYCYLTDDHSLKSGDHVVVPVGNDCRELTAQVVGIEYHSPEDAPFPLDRIKKVIRKDGDYGKEDGGYVEQEESETCREKFIVTDDFSLYKT